MCAARTFQTPGQKTTKLTSKKIFQMRVEGNRQSRVVLLYAKNGHWRSLCRDSLTMSLMTNSDLQVSHDECLKYQFSESQRRRCGVGGQNHTPRRPGQALIFIPSRHQSDLYGMVWIYGKCIKKSDGHTGTPSCVIINSYHRAQESSAQKELGRKLACRVLCAGKASHAPPLLNGGCLTTNKLDTVD